MSQITRLGDSRWSDVVIHAGVAYWVEVAADLDLDSAGQIAQVLAQIDATLVQVGSRERLLQVLIYLADLQDVSVLNEQWDVWVPQAMLPSALCVGAALGKGCRVEMVITAAVS